jgi:hypothetical protein
LPGNADVALLAPFIWAVRYRLLGSESKPSGVGQGLLMQISEVADNPHAQGLIIRCDQNLEIVRAESGPPPIGLIRIDVESP